MVRSVRGSKRNSTKEAVADSPTQVATEAEKRPTSRRRGVSPHALAGRSRTNRTRTPSTGRKRGSRRSNWTESQHGNEGGDQNFDPLAPSQHTASYHHVPASYYQHSVPSGWTTASGKFAPQRLSELNFDAKSNMAINVRSSITVNTGSHISDDSPHSDRSESKPCSRDKGRKNLEDETSLLEGEIADPVERHRFHKTLKKAGIKKTICFDDDSSTCSDVSELSIGNASYILDLAQQKETRKKDREEVALEEALELYGTWLQEGKNDDKNIFLMILHEVKKEQKAKYRKHDKRHDALLVAALDEELKRRERVKKEDEEEEKKKAEAKAKAKAKADAKVKAKAKAKAKAALQRTEPEIAPVPEDKIIIGSEKVPEMSTHTRSYSYAKQSHSKISEIIEQNASQRNIVDKDSDEEDDDRPEEWLEPYNPPESSKSDGSKPRSSKGLFRVFGSARKVQGDPTGPSPPRSERSMGSNYEKEDSIRMFSRLRRQLSEKQAEQWKEHDKSWNKKSVVLTQEEKWFKKINDAPKEKTLFDNQVPQLDLTTRTTPARPLSKQKSAGKLDLTTRTAPSNTPDTPEIEPKRRVSPRRKKTNKAPKDSDSIGDSKKNHDTKKKKKNDKKTSEMGDASSTEVDEKKLSKSKDKKKKKKSSEAGEDEEKSDVTKKAQSAITKKKKETASVGGSTNGRSTAFSDESDSKSLKLGKKKKSKSIAGKKLVTEDSPTKKKKEKISASLKSQKKKKKCRSVRSVRSGASEDALQGDSRSTDWTNRCIVHTHSDETPGAETVVTMESALQ